MLMGQAELKPPGWTCTAFPDKKNGWHFLTVIAIQIVIMFPVKFVPGEDLHRGRRFVD